MYDLSEKNTEKLLMQYHQNENITNKEAEVRDELA